MANELTYQSVFTGQEMDERFTAVAQLQAALLEVETALSAKYVKPASGIPETDLDSAVQSALAKARSAVQDLSNYYTKTEIDSLLAAVNSQEYVDVAALPTASASTLGKIYLVGPTNNQYDRYYTSYDGSDYSWVAAGSTEINLSNYATKAELNQLDQEINELGGPNYTPGKYLKANGVETEKDGWGITDYIPYTSGNEVEWKYGSPDAGTYVIQFYDSSKNAINNAYWGAQGTNGVRVLSASGIAQYAANGAYLRASFRTTINDAYVKIGGTTAWTPTITPPGIASRVTTLESQAATFAEDGRVLDMMTTDNLFTATASEQTKETVVCTPGENGTYVLNGTATGAGYIWLNTGAKIPVKQGDKIAVLGKTVNSARYSQAYKLYKNGTQITINSLSTNSVLTIGDADQLELGVSIANGVTYTNEVVKIIAVSAYSAVYPLFLQENASVKRKPRPMLTIIDDDGAKKFKTLLLPIIEAKKVPIATAVVGKNIDDPEQTSIMSWEDIADCAAAGAEVLSHSYSHVTETKAEEMTQAEVQYDYQLMQNLLRLHGYTGAGLVYAGGSSNVTKCVNACKLVHDFGFKASANQTNTVDNISRYGIYRWGVVPGTDDLEEMLDGLAAAGTGWMVWMTHTSDGSFQQASATALADAIDYARTLGIDIVSAAAGVEYYLNGRT